MMVLVGEEELKCEVYVEGIQLEHVSEFIYLGYVLGESGTDDAGAIRSLVNARVLQFQCFSYLHESLLVPALTYDSEVII